MTQDTILSATDIKVHFPVRTGGIIRGKYRPLRAVDGVSFHVERGETLAVVGESGCGKSTLGRAALMLTRPTSGSVEWLGEDVTHITRKVRQLRRRNVQLVFQDPLSSLNPRMTIGDIIAEPVRSFFPEQSDADIQKQVAEMMERVGLLPAMINRYPHEFSGGQCQRISIARAIIVKPKLVFLDEPVSALDVSIQAQILNLLNDLQEEFQLSYLFVSHDLSVVRYFSDRILVMYLGKLMEVATRTRLFEKPSHPYTRSLIAAVPSPDPDAVLHTDRALLDVELPSPLDPPSGCRFRTRCSFATEKCAATQPELQEIAPGHSVACHHWEKVADLPG